MDTVDKPLARPRRPALLAGAAAVTGCAVSQVDLPGWLAVALLVLAGFACTAALLVSRVKRYTLAALLAFTGVVCVFAAYGFARRIVPPDDLVAVFPEDAELARIEGVIVEGGD